MDAGTSWFWNGVVGLPKLADNASKNERDAFPWHEIKHTIYNVLQLHRSTSAAGRKNTLRGSLFARDGLALFASPSRHTQRSENLTNSTRESVKAIYSYFSRDRREKLAQRQKSSGAASGKKWIPSHWQQGKIPPQFP
jgi:hypothetical protein